NRVDENPSTSTRDVAREVQVSKTKVWQTLREEGLYPFHVQRVHALQPDAFPARVRFCEWLLHQHDNNPDFLKCILVTDESTFTRNGVNNFRNTHVWSVENPHAVRRAHFQQTFSVNVWAGMVNVIEDRHVTYCEIEVSLKISKTSIQKILHEKFRIAVWVFQGEEKPPKVIRSRTGHIATIPLNEQRSVAANWYTTISLPKAITELRKSTPKEPKKRRQYLTEETPDLSPNDFFTFPKIKNRLRGQRFQSPEEAWNKCFENWFERKQMCINLRGEYFEKQ
ncbi:unnamed protein product, partial [Acanthoscelides obtectus]